ncbi:ABC transporter substrate-binding protein [Cardiobacteriaceae bacterium TAE3-ERU3]|nr:ABC transporter substrate-binding protein [Cardiobacteriaceae bacterium TAE3-ERU3]
MNRFFLICAAALTASGFAHAQDKAQDSNDTAAHLLSAEEIAAFVPNIDDYPADPQRIAAMEFSFVGGALAAGKRPTAISDDGNPEKLIPEFRDAVGEYTSLGSRYQPNIESIADAKPDLIIADKDRHTVIKDDLEKIAPTLFVKSRGEDYYENLQAAQVIGHVLHQDDTMSKSIEDHLQKMRDARDALQGSKMADETVQFAVITDKGMWMHGPTSYAGTVISSLGLKSPIPEQTEEAYIPTSLEQLLAADPDWLLVGRYNDHTVLEDWKDSPLYQNLKAVKNDHVVEVDSSYWSLSRSMPSAERMAQDLIAHSQE